MIDEQEIPGASDNVNDAPSLEASRRPKREVQPSQRIRDIQASQTVLPPRKRKQKAPFEVFQDQPTPPSTQRTDQSSQEIARELSQEGPSQKRARKSIKKSSQKTSPLEPWDAQFEVASTTQAKVEVLLETLGHEDFPDPLQIPSRMPNITFDETELDPLNPLPIWHRFIKPEILDIIATNTNENETLAYEQKEQHTKWERAWHDISGHDVGAFFGASMLMGVHHMNHIEDYWNCSEDKPVFPLQSYMSRQRFEQFTRYLKINSPHEELDDAHFWYKVEPLSSSFREASQITLRLGDTINIDENLYSAKTRSKHTIQIDNKAAGRGYKEYTLCTGYYVWDFLYTSKVVPVPEAEDFTPHNTDAKAFTDTERVVLTLVKRLLTSHPPETKFRIAFDNFFTSHRLYEELRHWGVGAFGTAKAGSGMPRPHIRMREVCTKEANHGEIVNTVGKGRVNFITFVDQKAVWMMSTVHDVANEPWCWRPSTKRSKKTSTKYARTSIDGELQLRYPLVSYEYNHGMNGSDLCQQVWNYFTTTTHPHSRNWWPLLWMIIDASIANVLYIFRLKGFKITHTQLQERLGLQLLRNPASVNRKRNSRSFVSIPRPSLLKRPANEHQWERIPRRWCVVCKPVKRTRGYGREERRVLQERGINTIRTQPVSKKRTRGKQTQWGCYQCNVALCHTSDCWQQHHQEDEDEGDSHSEAMSISSFDES